ncbi:MAG: FAD-binding oxidoreductase [Verrucomicrobiales bacterium]|nr:FAD-binding protein [Verrucomicrobiae bacterium]MCP5552891.1 FAD-binding protein [Akkermansiaceae bacterium]
MPTDTGSTLASDLTALLGRDRVSTLPEVLQTHSIDKWHASAPPDVVVLAKEREDVVKTLRYASAHGIPVTTRGAGVGYVGGCVPVRGGIVLSVRGMDRILEINPADGVAVVQPGVILGDLQAAVLKRGWYYPPDPASLKECSIGGNIATNAGGPRCLKYGVTRHYVLGLEVVLASGEVLRTGGRCHKNKTGFDLIGMFVGSEGLLGVVTEATLRLIPHPPARATFSASFATFAAAADAVQTILDAGYLPAALEIADAFTLEAARAYPGNTAAPKGEAHLLLDIDGQPDAVNADAASLMHLLGTLSPVSLTVAHDDATCDELWEIRRSFSYSLRATGLVKLNEDIVVPRGRLVDLAAFSKQLQEESGFAVASFGHAGDGNIHVNIMVDQAVIDGEPERVEAALDRLFRQVLDWGGAITGEHGIGLAKKRWYPDAVSPVAQDVHERLKRALDPLGILNPGKFVA